MHDHLDHLHDTLFGFARAMLDRFGEFHPFGGYLLPDGHVVHVDFDRTLREAPLETLAAALGELDPDAIAHALVVDFDLPQPRDGMHDAVCMFMAQVEGRRVELLMPYYVRMGAATMFGAPVGVRGAGIRFR